MPTAIKSTSNTTPAFFFSHGSTMMLGEKSAPAQHWEEMGREAMRRGIKRVIMMGAHWESSSDAILVASNAGNPKKQPVAWVEPSRYVNYKINSSPKLANQIVSRLTQHGIKAKLEPDHEWIHDSFIILCWMFPATTEHPEGQCPEVSLISGLAVYNAPLIVDVGKALRSFRDEDTLIIGTGGTVHNLYRNNWKQITVFRDNFAQERPPDKWALDFRLEVEDAVTKNNGPALIRAVLRLMRHPLYRDAHATDDHFVPLLFVAGAAGSKKDEGKLNKITAECWELQNMCNTRKYLFKPPVTGISSLFFDC
ncbi:LigB subunit of an aromatic-ring-opening dioxygenase LigAB [Testicularia cyperi]|uniref:LigB subunit of an aromatic-ring-opening dioxygenase LigAB n=1 Tax=Testicularia cyperi TaxID=1882483 RepID=A0A317XG92_9BASI|nr:LigB subunit of an aromatic-ring-opening dioxygenase LigAB [Testicularia cyperi]